MTQSQQMDELLDVLIESGGKTSGCPAPACTLGSKPSDQGQMLIVSWTKKPSQG